MPSQISDKILFKDSFSADFMFCAKFQKFLIVGHHYYGQSVPVKFLKALHYKPGTSLISLKYA